MVNEVRLIGNIGKNTELRHTTSGKSVASASLAVTEKYKDAQGNLVENTEWANLEFWGKQAENAAKMLLKGAGVAIAGRLRTESYEDKEGVKRYKTKIVVDSFYVTKHVAEKQAA